MLALIWSYSEEHQPQFAKRSTTQPTDRIRAPLETRLALPRFDIGVSSHFQNLPHSTPILAGKIAQKTVLMPQRSVLHERINQRTEWMIANGAADEVEALLALDLPPESTVLKAIGVSQLGSYLHGKLSIKQATEQVKAATRQYAKRQSTWFNGQFDQTWQFREVI